MKTIDRLMTMREANFMNHASRMAAAMRDLAEAAQEGDDDAIDLAQIRAAIEHFYDLEARRPFVQGAERSDLSKQIRAIFRAIKGYRASNQEIGAFLGLLVENFAGMENATCHYPEDESQIAAMRLAVQGVGAIDAVRATFALMYPERASQLKDESILWLLRAWTQTKCAPPGTHTADPIFEVLQTVCQKDLGIYVEVAVLKARLSGMRPKNPLK